MQTHTREIPYEEWASSTTEKQPLVLLVTRGTGAVHAVIGYLSGRTAEQDPMYQRPALGDNRTHSMTGGGQLLPRGETRVFSLARRRGAPLSLQPRIEMILGYKKLRHCPNYRRVSHACPTRSWMFPLEIWDAEVWPEISEYL